MLKPSEWVSSERCYRSKHICITRNIYVKLFLSSDPSECPFVHSSEQDLDTISGDLVYDELRYEIDLSYSIDLTFFNIGLLV